MRSRSLLAEVNPRDITMDDQILSPTSWDQTVLQEDLNVYISLSRIIKATPEVIASNGKLLLKSGKPFVLAAIHASPPIERIVCQITAEDGTLHDENIKKVTPTELLDRLHAEPIYTSPEILTFDTPLSPHQRRLVEDAVVAFFREMTSRPGHGGRYADLSELTWNASYTRMQWTWQKADTEGTYVFLFFDMLKDLHNALPLRSWNGFRPETFDYKRKK